MRPVLLSLGPCCLRDAFQEHGKTRVRRRSLYMNLIGLCCISVVVTRLTSKLKNDLAESPVTCMN